MLYDFLNRIKTELPYIDDISIVVDKDTAIPAFMVYIRSVTIRISIHESIIYDIFESTDLSEVEYHFLYRKVYNSIDMNSREVKQAIRLCKLKSIT